MSFLRGRLKNRRALGALLLLTAWAAVGVVAPALHQLGHAEAHEHGHDAGPSVSSACPADCVAPGHDHSAHGLATCHACQALHAPALLASHAARALAAPASIDVEVDSPACHAHEATSWASPRGPPAHLLS